MNNGVLKMVKVSFLVCAILCMPDTRSSGSWKMPQCLRRCTPSASHPSASMGWKIKKSEKCIQIWIWIEVIYVTKANEIKMAEYRIHAQITLLRDKWILSCSEKCAAKSCGRPQRERSRRRENNLWIHLHLAGKLVEKIDKWFDSIEIRSRNGKKRNI